MTDDNRNNKKEKNRTQYTVQSLKLFQRSKIMHNTYYTCNIHYVNNTYVGYVILSHRKIVKKTK